MAREVHALRNCAVCESPRDLPGDAQFRAGETLPAARRSFRWGAATAAGSTLSRPRAGRVTRSANAYVCGGGIGESRSCAVVLTARKQRKSGVLLRGRTVPRTGVLGGAALQQV